MPIVSTHMEGVSLIAEISALCDIEEFTYAYYLFVNNEIKEKIWYRKETTATFTLHENGIYYVVAFLKRIQSGEVKTVRSAPFRYIKGRNPNMIPFIRIEEMEMTNICNLACQNCCTPTTRYPRGFIDDGTVLEALSWTQKGQTLNYHRQGEPLLHDKLEKYVKLGRGAGICPVISTNGKLLSTERLEGLYRNGLRHLVITLHAEDSLRSFLNACAYFERQEISVWNFSERHKKTTEEVLYFSGKVLEFSDDVSQSKEMRQAIASIPERYRRLLQFTPTHTWAGNVPDTRRDFEDTLVLQRRSNCYFIHKKVVNMRWDGSIVGCCFDSENENMLGHIRDFSHLNMDLSKYKLCRHCDANWATLEAGSDL